MTPIKRLFLPTKLVVTINVLCIAFMYNLLHEAYIDNDINRTIFFSLELMFQVMIWIWYVFL